MSRYTPYGCMRLLQFGTLYDYVNVQMIHQVSEEGYFAKDV